MVWEYPSLKPGLDSVLQDLFLHRHNTALVQKTVHLCHLGRQNLRSGFQALGCTLHQRHVCMQSLFLELLKLLRGFSGFTHQAPLQPWLHLHLFFLHLSSPQYQSFQHQLFFQDFFKRQHPQLHCSRYHVLVYFFCLYVLRLLQQQITQPSQLFLLFFLHLSSKTQDI